MRLLVANRGEIAVRIFSAARELGYFTLAIYTEDDDSHIGHANQAIQIPSVATFLDLKALLDLCQRHKVDIVHPGYGFLSESANFASLLRQNGIYFVGPSVKALEITGDKLKARGLAEECNVPVLPALTEAVNGISKLLTFAEKVDYPIMLKAADGGGGRGIRLVRKEADLEPAFKRAIAESPSGRVFAEKAAVDGFRHIEVQILGDGEQICHFFERECSIQRRYQKVVELAPASISNRKLVSRVIKSAVLMAQRIRYQSLGTFEFLVSSSNDRFYFLEINPRLQVEHTVTESITGVDLVQLQLLVSSGKTLKELGFQSQPSDASPPPLKAIQLRVTAEDVQNNFALSVGRLNKVQIPGGNGTRFDTHIQVGTEISTAYDSLLGKIIVWGDSATVIRRAIRALEDLQVRGITTNTVLLYGVLLSDDFNKGACDTTWLERHLRPLIESGSRALQKVSKPESSNQSSKASSGPSLNTSTLIRKGDTWNVSLSPNNSQPLECSIRVSTIKINNFPSTLDAEVTISGLEGSQFSDSKRGEPYRLRLRADDDASSAPNDHKLSASSKSESQSNLICPLSGQLVEILVDEGDQVEEFEPVVIVRQMKMELEVRAHRKGVVSNLWEAEEGEDVVQGSLVCRILEPVKEKL